MNRKEDNSIGKLGEELAAKYLMEKGQIILRRNFRAKGGEIDIISVDSNGIHFVEVKTRRPPMMTSPLEAVGISKQRRIVSCANKWLNSADGEGGRNMDCSFDVVGVTIEADGNTIIDYIQQAFIPLYV